MTSPYALGIVCDECGLHCRSFDLYYDHLTFDKRHAYFAKRNAELRQKLIELHAEVNKSNPSAPRFNP
ncbi:hypothetical protein EV182_005030, partial [Spiromyces aspiralis]